MVVQAMSAQLALVEKEFLGMVWALTELELKV
jgi:hypothetical protein